MGEGNRPDCPAWIVKWPEMTISRERRYRDQASAIRTIAADVGDAALFEKHWAVADPRFAELVPTTWVELEEKSLIRRRRIMSVGPQYHLTEDGWLEGLRLIGALQDPSFRERVVNLIQFFKGTIAGRRETADAIIHYSRLPQGMPFGFVLNALKSGLLQHMFPDKRMNAYWDATKNIRVPVTFGMPVD